VQQEGAVPANEKIITVKHKTSGKTLRISAAAAAKYRMQGYHYHPVNEAKDEQEYGYEGDMALNQLATLTRCADMIKELLKPDTDMPEWVQSKITLATDYIQTAADYMYSEIKEEVEQHKEIDTHTEVEDGSHQDKNDTKDLHDRIKAAAKKHGATITYQDKPSLRGSHTISARGSQDFHKEVKHIASNYEHLGVQHEINEEVEHLNEDDGLKSIAKKHGMEYHPGTYGANMSHAKKGFVNINRYGEWSHHKQGRFDRGHGPATAHGDSSQNFKDLDKHLGTLKEEYEQIHEISDKLAGNYLKKVNDKLIKKVGMKPDLYNHLEPKRQKGATRALNRLMKPVEEGTSADSDGGPPTPAASTLTVTGQPKLTKTVGQTKMIPYVHEEKETKPPFDKPYTTTKAVVKDKSGAKHTPMSRARDLARKAMARKMEEQSNIEPNPFTIPSSNPGDAPEKKVKKASPVAPTAMAESRQLEIVREAMKVAKKKKEVTEAGTDKFIADPELTSQITKSNP